MKKGDHFLFWDLRGPVKTYAKTWPSLLTNPSRAPHLFREKCKCPPMVSQDPQPLISLLISAPLQPPGPHSAPGPLRGRSLCPDTPSPHVPLRLPSLFAQMSFPRPPFLIFLLKTAAPFFSSLACDSLPMLYLHILVHPALSSPFIF